jgi:hypothetical protein
VFFERHREASLGCLPGSVPFLRGVNSGPIGGLLTGYIELNRAFISVHFLHTECAATQETRNQTNSGGLMPDQPADQHVTLLRSSRSVVCGEELSQYEIELGRARDQKSRDRHFGVQIAEPTDAAKKKRCFWDHLRGR